MSSDLINPASDAVINVTGNNGTVENKKTSVNIWPSPTEEPDRVTPATARKKKTKNKRKKNTKKTIKQYK